MLRRYRLIFPWFAEAMATKTKPTSERQLRYDYAVFSVELGRRIRQLRKESGLTLRALIVQHGFHLTQIQRIEKGDGISVPMLLRIAQTFQVPLEKLVAGLGIVAEGSEPPSEPSKD